MVDITVRGAGILGLSIAWACVRRGARIQLIDPNGAGTGSSGGLVGALAPHVPENWNPKKDFQFHSLLRAETFWAEVEQAGGISSGYIRSGRLQPVQHAEALRLARDREQSAARLWGDTASWSLEKTTRTDWQPASPTGWLIRDTLSAHLHPKKACGALVAALASSGVTIAVEGKNKGMVVWATGLGGLETLNAHHHRRVGTGVKGQAALLRYDAGRAPQLFADTVHIIPHLDGTVAVGSTSEREYLDPTSTDRQLDQVIDRARAQVVALRDAPVIGRWAGVRPRSRSRAPVLGPWPGRPGHFVANGGFKIGFGMAPGISDAMANLLIDGNNTIPEDFAVEASL